MGSVSKFDKNMSKFTTEYDLKCPYSIGFFFNRDFSHISVYHKQTNILIKLKRGK